MNPFFLCRLRNLISYRIKNHRWMIEILLHHIFQILFPPLFKIVHIIIFCLMDIPYIHKLIHNQHSLPVTCFQKRFGTWIVCGSDRIISILFQDPDLTCLCIRITAGSKYTIIMMNAGSSKNHTFSIDRDSCFFIPFQSSDTKNNFFLVCLHVFILSILLFRCKCHTQPIQIWCIHTP